MASKKTPLKNGLYRKQLQKQASNLKRAGLIPKSVDIRKMDFTKHYMGLLRKHSDIAQGKATAAKIPSADVAKLLEERGDKVIKRGRSKEYLLVSPQTPKNRHTAKVTKRGEVIRTYRKTTPEGKPVRVRQRELPIKFENMEQWLSDLQAQGFQLKPGEKIYFTLFGNYSREAFATFEQAFNKFMTYEVVAKANEGALNPDTVQQLVRSVGFETVSGPAAESYNRDRITKPEMQFSDAAKRRHKRRVKRGYGTKGV